LYFNDPNAVFFGLPPEARMVQGTTPYLQSLATCLASFDQVQVSMDGNLNIDASGSLAVATLTGTNIVRSSGRTNTSPWRWTLALQEVSPGQWKIIHDHVSFNSVTMPSIPTLSNWGLLILAVLLIAIALFWIRRRSSRPIPA